MPFNGAITSSKFPSSLKIANIKAVFKNGTKSFKENQRPISVFPWVSKIFEKIIWKQLTNLFDNILSKYHYRFRTSHGTQHCLLLMLEKWKKSLDRKKGFIALITDLSKIIASTMNF